MRKIVLPVILLAILIVVHLLSFRQNPSSLIAPGIHPVVVLQEDLYAHSLSSSLSSTQKVGQLMFISIPPSATEQDLRDTLGSIHPGGILLFASNIRSAEQTRQLTSLLQQIAQEQGDPPLFIAVDEEGGVVERIWFDPMEYSAPELGSLNDEAAFRDVIKETAATLTDLGINVNFAPVADIAFSSNSIMVDRSYGSSVTGVSQRVSYAIDEYLKNGIFPTVKHFPGHGRTTVDSHETLPSIDISNETWLETDANPFRTAISTHVPFIMSGHIQYPQIDTNPASSSSVWLSQIVRDELGFNGIIVSDDIKMGAYSQDYATTALHMITAGNDMIIAAVDYDYLVDISNNLSSAIPQDSSDSQLNESVLRILRLKYNLSR